jgi:CHAT domain-containing protein
MTRAERIQTILRSELAQWRTMTKEQLIQNLINERADVLDELGIDTLDYMLEGVDVAEVWGQSM